MPPLRAVPAALSAGRDLDGLADLPPAPNRRTPLGRFSVVWKSLHSHPCW